VTLAPRKLKTRTCYRERAFVRSGERIALRSRKTAPRFTVQALHRRYQHPNCRATNPRARFPVMARSPFAHLAAKSPFVFSTIYRLFLHALANFSHLESFVFNNLWALLRTPRGGRGTRGTPFGRTLKMIGEHRQRVLAGSVARSALAPFQTICTPMHTSKNDVSCRITVIPVVPSTRPRRSAKL
jgi:hypothetical protein